MEQVLFATNSRRMNRTCSLHWQGAGRNGGRSISIVYHSPDNRLPGRCPRLFFSRSYIVCTSDEVLFAFSILLNSVDLMDSDYIEREIDSISNPEEVLDMPDQAAMSILVRLLVNNQEDSMTRKSMYGGEKQQLLPFEYKEEVKRLSEQHEAISKSFEDLLRSGPVAACGETEEELACEIAAALKQDLRDSGMSRDQFLDALNEALGRTDHDLKRGDDKKRPITLNMLNNYLSKPGQYSIPAHFLFAIHKIFGSYRVVNTIVGVEGAQVISGAEVRMLTKTKITELKNQAAMLEKML